MKRNCFAVLARRSIAAAAVLASCVALAAPEPKKTELTAGDFELLINSRLKSLKSEVARATAPAAFRDPTEVWAHNSLMHELDGESLSSNVSLVGRRETPEVAAANALYDIVRGIDSHSRSGLTLMTRSLTANDDAGRYWRIDRIVKRVQSEGYIKEFNDFDERWDSFRKLVKEMRDNKAVGVTGSELLVASGLDAYARTSDCTMTATIHRRVCALDGCLAKIDNEELKNFETAIRKLREYSAKTAEGLAYDWDRYNAAKKSLSATSAKCVGDLLTHIELFVQEVEKFADDAEKLLATVRDPSTEIGKLRTLTGFSPHRAFMDPSPAPHSDGKQRYVARVRMALIDAKKEYLAALAVCNKEARLTDRPDIRGWQ